MELSQESSPSPLRLIMTLGIAGFFSGLVLVSVYLSTLPIIEANKAAALKEAVFLVVPGCKSFKTLVMRGKKLVVQTNEGNTKQEKKKDAAEKIFVCYDDTDKIIGFAIPGGEPGFQDLIKGILGYNADQKIIIGFEVLESRETPGLGDKIMKDDTFRANFKALAVEPEITVVKPGTREANHEVETITGATISSKAVIRLLQKSMTRWRPVIADWVASQN
ncbi:MAG: FMN-binding protein [SAR324 cluster bacterium]|nr:FMN-binding protein [SAR324 cluster bacterium]